MSPTSTQDAPAIADSPYDLVLVGGGPRAVATVERVAARVRASGWVPASIAVIDAVEVGAGATWRTDQTRFFLNNTTAAATTIYPDATTPMDGPAADGPTFLAWASEIAARGTHSVPWVVAEAREITPASFPTRRLQGVYYNDQLARVCALGGVRLTRLLGSVVDVVRDGDIRTVRLADGRSVRAYAVVLAQGMVQAQATAEVAAFTEAANRLGLLYLPPGMPAERDWALVPAGEPVIARGLGANFFDVAAELTSGRGGNFVPVSGDAHGRLRYLPSGHEPVIYAVSRRGVPYRAKGDFGNAQPPRYTPRIADAAWFARAASAAAGSLDFAAVLWPFIAAELGVAWLSAVAMRTPEAVRVSPAQARQLLVRAAELDAASSASRSWVGAVPHVDRVLSEAAADPTAQFLLDELHRPTCGIPVSQSQWRQRVQQLVADELDSLANPQTSPRQAVNRAMAALRSKVSQLAVRGVLTPHSEVRDVHGWFNADGLFLASGPPASRVREVLALIEAGVVRLVGPQSHVTVDPVAGAFRAVSEITGVSVRARSLIETRMSKGNVPDTSDPLLRALLERGDARIHTLRRGDAHAATQSVEARPPADAHHPLSLVDAAGVPDPRVLVLGIPASSTQPGSAIGATPGVPSPLLAGADRAAAVVLTLRDRTMPS